MSEQIRSVTAFAPASVGNASAGFDVLGFALEHPGDEVTVTLSDKPGVHMGTVGFADSIQADDHMLRALPTEAARNVAGLVVLRMWESVPEDQRPAGLRVDLTKGCGIGTGMGSSAASVAAALKAGSHLLGNPFADTELLEIGMEGEALASGGKHADNLAPSLLGGFIGIRSYDPLDFFSIPVPDELWCGLLHPQVRVLTAEARAALPENIPLATGIAQWGNVASLVAGLYSSDYDRIGRSLRDYVAEPVRSMYIPGFELLQQTASAAGALGFGISGSGPSVFALCRGQESCAGVARAWTEAYVRTGVEFRIYQSKVSTEGARIIRSL